MANINSSRYQRWFVQQQASLLAFNNTAGAWTQTGAQLIRVDANSVSTVRNSPYSRFPVLTGTRSEVSGIRGRKISTWSIRGMPVIPSGSASTIPDMDIILQNIFGSAAASNVYTFADGGYLPFSLFGFVHGFTTLTNRALWGCYVTRAVLNYNGPFLTIDLEGFAGYEIDNTGFSAFDTQAKAGLTAFPLESGLATTVLGVPIAGFGTGYTATFHSQTLELKLRSFSITIETGFTPIAELYGSPYLVSVVGGTRRISVALTAVDDDSTALNDFKTQADTDLVGTGISASILAGNAVGSKVTCALVGIQPNAFSLRDNGPTVDVSLPESFAHASSVAVTDDMSMTFG